MQFILEQSNTEIYSCAIDVVPGNTAITHAHDLTAFRPIYRVDALQWTTQITIAKEARAKSIALFWPAGVMKIELFGAPFPMLLPEPAEFPPGNGKTR